MRLNIEKIEQIRAAYDEDVYEFAKRLNVSITLYKYLLSGKTHSTTLKTIGKIAKGLHIDPRELLTKGEHYGKDDQKEN